MEKTILKPHPGKIGTHCHKFLTMPLLLLACDDDWIGDGYCDDINNNAECSFDGGDCCGCIVNTEYCNECQCLEEGSGGNAHSTAVVKKIHNPTT